MTKGIPHKVYETHLDLRSMRNFRYTLDVRLTKEEGRGAIRIEGTYNQDQIPIAIVQGDRGQSAPHMIEERNRYARREILLALFNLEWGRYTEIVDTIARWGYQKVTVEKSERVMDVAMMGAAQPWGSICSMVNMLISDENFVEKKRKTHNY